LKVATPFTRSEATKGNGSSTHARLAQEDEQKRRLIGSKLLLKVATPFTREISWQFLIDIYLTIWY